MLPDFDRVNVVQVALVALHLRDDFETRRIRRQPPLDDAVVRWTFGIHVGNVRSLVLHSFQTFSMQVRPTRGVPSTSSTICNEDQ